MNFVMALFICSIFYIFYEPDYICLDADHSNPRPCKKEEACKPGQNYRFDSSTLN
jgi:hypothetical protein